MSEQVAATGIALPGSALYLATAVGVQNPQRIRIAMVDKLPVPDGPTLREATLAAGLLGPDMVGLTLGHSIFIVHRHDTARLVSHECRHVAQYEMHGSIASFLTEYLQQIVDHGYHDAPLEKDARAHELA